MAGDGVREVDEYFRAADLRDKEAGHHGQYCMSQKYVKKQSDNKIKTNSSADGHCPGMSPSIEAVLLG